MGRGTVRIVAAGETETDATSRHRRKSGPPAGRTPLLFIDDMPTGRQCVRHFRTPALAPGRSGLTASGRAAGGRAEGGGNQGGGGIGRQAVVVRFDSLLAGARWCPVVRPPRDMGLVRRRYSGE